MDRGLARRRLDERLRPWSALDDPPPPPRGWVRAIRDALGMSAAELGARAGVHQSRITRIEQSEPNGTVQLATMRHVAQALGCRLVYALVPDRPLEEMVTEQARSRAVEELSPVTHTMALEEQRPSSENERELLDELADAWVDRRGLWS